MAEAGAQDVWLGSVRILTGVILGAMLRRLNTRSSERGTILLTGFNGPPLVIVLYVVVVAGPLIGPMLQIMYSLQI